LEDEVLDFLKSRYVFLTAMSALTPTMKAKVVITALGVVSVPEKARIAPICVMDPYVAIE
jgi:hypothetical protein